LEEQLFSISKKDCFTTACLDGEPFYQILSEGQYKPGTTRPAMFGGLRSNVISVQNVWLEWWEMTLGAEEGVALGDNFLSSTVSILKKNDFKANTEVL